MAALAAWEVESLRSHLGWGNVGIGASPYAADGLHDVFYAVVGPYLTTAPETQASSEVAAPGTAVITPDSMEGIVAGTSLVVDVGADMEIVQVRSATLTTFSARFKLAHPASGYLVAVMSGRARLRILLNALDRLWEQLQGAAVGGTAGIKQLGQGEIEWFGPTAVRDGLAAQYEALVLQLSALVRVPPNPDRLGFRRGSPALEVY